MAETAEVLKSGVAPARRHFYGAQVYAPMRRSGDWKATKTVNGAASSVKVLEGMASEGCENVERCAGRVSSSIHGDGLTACY
jgi:hypothetical protein